MAGTKNNIINQYKILAVVSIIQAPHSICSHNFSSIHKVSPHLIIRNFVNVAIIQAIIPNHKADSAQGKTFNKKPSIGSLTDSKPNLSKNAINTNSKTIKKVIFETICASVPISTSTHTLCNHVEIKFALFKLL
jgi:hypothetical protein